MEKDQKVIIVPNDQSSDDFNQKVSDMGEVQLTVLSAPNTMGMCVLLLPEGVQISGYSKPFPAGKDSIYGDCHYLDLHKSNLQIIFEEEVSPTSGFARTVIFKVTEDWLRGAGCSPTVMTTVSLLRRLEELYGKDFSIEKACKALDQLSSDAIKIKEEMQKVAAANR